MLRKAFQGNLEKNIANYGTHIVSSLARLQILRAGAFLLIYWTCRVEIRSLVSVLVCFR